MHKAIQKMQTGEADGYLPSFDLKISENSFAET
jgi:hypothetical protein